MAAEKTDATIAIKNYSGQGITSKDGTELYLHHWHDDSVETKAILLIFHSYTDHGGRYHDFATKALIPNGISTFCVDLRGHGKSAGEPRGFLKSSFMEYHEDVMTALDKIKEFNADKNVPLFFFGHGVGALIIFDYLQQQLQDTNKVKGVIVTTPNLARSKPPSWSERQSLNMFYKTVPNHLMPTEASGGMLTHDKEKQKDYDTDPLVFYTFTLMFAKQQLETSKRVIDHNKNHEFPCPILILLPSQDKVSNIKIAREFVQDLKHNDKTVITRPKALHEILIEEDHQEVYDLILNWINKRL